MFLPPVIPHRFRRIPQQRIRRHNRPRGIAVVMVLGLLAITIAISYATLRGQGTTTQLARNGSRSLEARAAARSGIAAALRAMSENAWGGVSTTLSSNVTDNSRYVVTFRTGDDKLTDTDPSYGEWPFRVTIDSVGTASDPLNNAIQSQYKSRCIVQLLRKNMVAEPNGWSTIITQNVYQFSNLDAYVQFPVRINGNVTLMGKLKFCTDYPDTSFPGDANARDKYLIGLKNRAATLGDYRPFPVGKTFLKGLATQQDLTTVTTMLLTDMGVVASEESLLLTSPPGHPGAPLTYKLYPGGQDFNVTPLVSPLAGQTFAPVVKTNPLGIYRSSGTLTIQSNVNVTGTIITEDSGGADIQITGTNVVLKSSNLPALYGTSQAYQLPNLVARSNVVVNSAADVQFTGATLCWKQFEVWNNDLSTATKLALTGNLITDTLLQHGRSTWKMTALQWKNDYTAWANSGYFPDYEQTLRSFTVKPTLTFSPDSSGVKPHWHDWSQPVYQPDPADPGLKWEVVRWEENLQ